MLQGLRVFEGQEPQAPHASRRLPLRLVSQRGGNAWGAVPGFWARRQCPNRSEAGVHARNDVIFKGILKARFGVLPCYSGREDGIMDEIPTVVVEPLPQGVDQVWSISYALCASL